MTIEITENGVAVKLSCEEALVVLEELGDLPARRSQKLRQLHAELTRVMDLRGIKEPAPEAMRPSEARSLFRERAGAKS
jgi:hypothetical protein